MSERMISSVIFMSQAFIWLVTSLFEKLCCPFLIEGWSWNSTVVLKAFHSLPQSPFLALSSQASVPVTWSHMSLSKHSESLSHLHTFAPTSSLYGFPTLISILPHGKLLVLSATPGRMHHPFICAPLKCWASFHCWNRTCMFPAETVCSCFRELPGAIHSLWVPCNLLIPVISA